MPLHCHLIESADFGRIPVRNGIGRNILNDFRAATSDREGAYTAELMHRSEAADNGMVTHLDMARNRAVVRKNYSVSDSAVVSHMAVGKEIPVVANPRARARSGSSVHGNEFSKGISFSDMQVGGFSRVLQILGLLADRAKGKKLVIPPDLRRSHQSNLALKPAVLS